MKVLSLIEENTAAALQYGKDRVFDEANHTVLFYNMGAASTQVSIATYSAYSGKENGKNKSIGIFEVNAKSWDAELGGTDFDMVLTELFADEFNTQWGKGEVREHPRAMAKLRAQALKTKHVLSANTEIPVKVNSLHDDLDFKMHITRTAFEEKAAGLLARITTPIDEALAKAELTVEQLDSVEMIGGAQRIPKIQSILGEYFGGKPLSVHVNADEGAALGAAFHAANLSTSFKVRKTGMVDFTTLPVAVGLKSIPKDVGLLGGLFGGNNKEAEEEAMAWNKSTTLFKEGSKLDSKKTIAFHHDYDIACNVSYDASATLPATASDRIAAYNITGIANFAKEMAAKGLDKPKVTLTFRLDSSGLLSISKAEATVEVAPDPVNETAANETAAEEDETAAEEDETAAAANATDANATDTKDKKKDKKSKKKDKEKKEKKKVYRVELDVTKDYALEIAKPHGPAEVENSLAKLANLQRLDQLRKEKEEAKVCVTCSRTNLPSETAKPPVPSEQTDKTISFRRGPPID